MQRMERASERRRTELEKREDVPDLSNLKDESEVVPILHDLNKLSWWEGGETSTDDGDDAESEPSYDGDYQLPDPTPYTKRAAS